MYSVKPESIAGKEEIHSLCRSSKPPFYLLFTQHLNTSHQESINQLLLHLQDRQKSELNKYLCFEEVCRQHFSFKSNNWTHPFRHMWQNECLQSREMRSFLLPTRPLCLPSLITCHTQPDSRFNWFRVFVTGAAQQHNMSSSLSSYSTQSAQTHCTSIISISSRQQ